MFNCEDILTDYIILQWHMTQGKMNGTGNDDVVAVEFVRPHCRLDSSAFSFFTHVGGISHSGSVHTAMRRKCATVFASYVSGRQLPVRTIDDDDVAMVPSAISTPICWIPFIGCVYL